MDHYHRFKEDIKLMAEQGLKAYRFSIAWTRIFPNGRGDVNQSGIDFYMNLIDELRKNKIEPIVTLYHWDLPQILQDEYGGWESRKIIPDFVNYAKTLFEAFNGKVKYWISLNEQNIFTSFGWQQALHPPGKTNDKLFYQVNHIANLVNAATINIFHELNISGQIGPSFAYTPQYSYNSDPINVLAAENAEELTANFWLDVYLYGSYPHAAVSYLRKQGVMPKITKEDEILLKSAKPDFIGINYYQSSTNSYNPLGGVGRGNLNTTGKKGSVKESGVPGVYKKVVNPYTNRTNWDWEIDPIGLRIAIRRLTSRYRMPILITENGLGEYDKIENGKVHDYYRINYLSAHVTAIQEAISDGANVLGYCTWSYTDLLSWLNGYQKRYGFIYVDQDETQNGSQVRYKKDSYYWYKNLIEKHSELTNRKVKCE